MLALTHFFSFLFFFNAGQKRVKMLSSRYLLFNKLTVYLRLITPWNKRITIDLVISDQTLERMHNEMEMYVKCYH